MVLVGHLLLAASVGLLFGAGVRAASRMTGAAPERVVAAAVFAAAAAVIEALAFGLVGLGTSPGVLFAAAALTWLGTRRLVGDAESVGPNESAFEAPLGADRSVSRLALPLASQLAGWWEGLSPRARLVAGALAGGWLAWTVWLLRYPAFDLDGLAYHIPEVVRWVHGGHPGSIVSLVPGYPYGSFPVTNEVLLAWGSGIARSFVWITVWPSVMFALLAVSAWSGLRVLGVPRLAAGLATVSVCAAPMATSFQLYGANSDFPALVWLVAAGALCAACTVGGQARLFPAVLVAAALAVGTKTTAAPLAFVVVVFAAFRLRGQLRALGLPLLLAAVAALTVGGTWYLRNLVEHGSPLWPFFALPRGDPRPHLLGGAYDFTFFNHPLTTLGRFGEAHYVTDTFTGALIALVGALLAPLLVRRRAVAWCAALTGLSVFLWTFAPDTGVPARVSVALDALHGSPRLLMPGVVVATLTLALAVRARVRPATAVGTMLLATIAGVNVWQLFSLSFLAAPSVPTPLIGALAGAAVALAARRWPARAILRPLGIAGCTVLVGVLLAIAAPDLVERHERLGLNPRTSYLDASLIALFNGPGADRRPIYTAPVMIAMLVGDDLSRDVEPIPRLEPCGRLEARARRGWVVVIKNSNSELLLGPTTTPGCVGTWHADWENATVAIYDARSLPKPLRS